MRPISFRPRWLKCERNPNAIEIKFCKTLLVALVLCSQALGVNACAAFRNYKMSRTPAYHQLGVLLGATLMWFQTCNANNEHGRCYGYLTGLVRSSNFPFTYVTKDKANLLIDDDQGETVSAQVVFDTDGSGTMGWVQYDIQTHKLLNTSAELEEPVLLRFNKKCADQYEHCISDD